MPETLRLARALEVRTTHRHALGEPVASASDLDRLEQLGWPACADAWCDPRRIRDEFAHDDPDAPQKRRERPQTATAATSRGMAVLADIEHRIRQRYPEIRSPAP